MEISTHTTPTVYHKENCSNYINVIPCATFHTVHVKVTGQSLLWIWFKAVIDRSAVEGKWIEWNYLIWFYPTGSTGTVYLPSCQQNLSGGFLVKVGTVMERAVCVFEWTHGASGPQADDDDDDEAEPQSALMQCCADMLKCVWVN